MASKVPSKHKKGIAETKAFTSFLESFLINYGDVASTYSFNITDLKTKLQELPKADDHYLIFFFYHPCSEFSINVCTLLLDPDIRSAFESDRFILYAWNIEHKSLLDDLRIAFFDQLRVRIEDIKYTSRVFVINWDVDGDSFKPCIQYFWSDVSELETFRSLLLCWPANMPVENPENADAASLAPMENTVESFQLRMRDFMGHREYNSYDFWEHMELKQCIAYALFGPPTTDEELGYDPKQKEKIEKFYELIRNENNNVRKWPDKIVISYVFVCIEPFPKEKKNRQETALKNNLPYNPSEDYIPYPVFLIQKCKNSKNPCRIVIDHDLRVYQSWEYYLSNNKLPPGVMVYPKGGRYPSRNFQGPFLCKRNSPACSITTKIVGTMDVVAGGASMAVPLLAAAAPIALPIATVAGIGAVAYGGGRAVYGLVDRKMHKQDISLTNSESRAAYLNLAMTICSAATLGTSKLVAALTSEGIQFGTGAKCLIFTVNGISVAVSGVGIGNGVYELIRSREITPLAFCQLSASILFFLHSVYSFKCIQENLKNNNSSVLNEALWRIQAMFNSMALKNATLRDMCQNLVDRIVDMIYRNVITVKNGELFLREGLGIFAQLIIRKGQRNFMDNFPPLPENLNPNTQLQMGSDINKWLKDLFETSISDLLRENISEKLLKEVFGGFQKIIINYVMRLCNQFLMCLNEDLYRFAKRIIVTAVKWIVNQLINMSVIDKIRRYATLTHEEDTIVTNNLKTGFVDFIANINEEIDSIERVERKQRRHEYGRRKYKTNCKSCTGYHFQ